MSKSKRAMRRHHRERMIKKALNKLRIYDWTDEEKRDYAVRAYNHMAVCSCPMCCNPRRNGWETRKTRLTMQERKVYNVKLEKLLEEYYHERTDAANESI